MLGRDHLSLRPTNAPLCFGRAGRFVMSRPVERVSTTALDRPLTTVHISLSGWAACGLDLEAERGTDAGKWGA